MNKLMFFPKKNNVCYNKISLRIACVNDNVYLTKLAFKQFRTGTFEHRNSLIAKVYINILNSLFTNIFCFYAYNLTFFIVLTKHFQNILG